MNERSLRSFADLLSITAQTIHNAGFADGLTPAQWSALRYFSQANESACTLNDFAVHHGTTKGTASRTISRLVEKGCLRRQVSADDSRVRIISVTAQGRTRLENDPLGDIVPLLKHMEHAQIVEMTKMCTILVKTYRQLDRE